MQLLYADNVELSLTSGKAAGDNFLTIPPQIGGVGGWWEKFSGTHFSGANSYVVPITLTDSDNVVQFNGYVTWWDFYTDNDKLYIDNNLTTLTIPAGLTLSVRLRALDYLCHNSRHRDYVYVSNVDPFGHSGVGVSELSETSFVDADFYYGGTLRIQLNSDSNFMSSDETSYAETQLRTRRKTIVILDRNNNITGITVVGTNYDQIHWKDGIAPTPVTNYRRMRIYLDLVDQYHWVGTWEKFAD